VISKAIARRRVPLGFLCGAVVLWLAQPTWDSLAIGGALAAAGEALRVWAAGHVEKSREVTRSGPYHWLRHPLYVGSSIIGAGLAVTAASRPVAILIAVYLLTTIPAAILAEEAHLREKFGGAYDAYIKRQSPPMVRSFSLARARSNREHQTVIGLMAALALLALKVQLSIR
jgi:protein-S-isoprenylcysteine O-methyltransferase Ste14